MLLPQSGDQVFLGTGLKGVLHAWVKCMKWYFRL